MKAILSSVAMASVVSMASIVHAAPVQSFDLSGTYDCSGFDAHAGHMPPEKTIITRDDKSVVPDMNFSGYHFTSKTYSGYIAGQGDSFAVSFINHDKKDPDASIDYGVGIYQVTFDADKKGKMTMVLRGAYYQPTYHRETGGGTGSVICYKV